MSVNWLFPWWIHDWPALFMTQAIFHYQIHQTSRRTDSAHCCPSGQSESSWECGGDDAHDEGSFHRCKGMFKMTHSCLKLFLMCVCLFYSIQCFCGNNVLMIVFHSFRAEQIWSLTAMDQWSPPLRRRKERDGTSLRGTTRYETVYNLQWGLLKKRSDRTII